MKSKVYYGEYTLRHWIMLMLKGNIVLPEYQRHFVWEERDVERLIKSLKDGQFVPPVTIALYGIKEDKKNLIIDGQQRLTSLLLAYIGYFPDKKEFEMVKNTMSEDDSDENDTALCPGVLWRYDELLKHGKTKDEIVEKIDRDKKYLRLNTNINNLNINDDFLDRTYLGFSYVVPCCKDASEMQAGFSQIFRNINYFGKKLDPIESRKSLYYINPELTRYFEGMLNDKTFVLYDLKVEENFQPRQIDFVRYLSILSQYWIFEENCNIVMRGYSAYKSRESFYADYVSYIVGMEQEGNEDKFKGFDLNKVIPNNERETRFQKLQTAVIRLKSKMPLKEDTSFLTGYEADYWLFGLIYHVLFQGEKIKEGDVELERLKDNISKKIKEDRDKGEVFVKNANRLGNIRNRLDISCKIYNCYVE